jgi:hypothetical protein
MPRAHLSHRLLWLVIAFCAMVAAPAGALTYVMATDAELLERASVVVVGRVLEREDAPSAFPRTDYLVEVERPVKGFVPASTIIVRLPGGRDDHGRSLWLPGAPAFAAGESVLLFLDAGADGAFELADLGLAAFRENADGPRRLLVRDLSSARELGGGSNPSSLANDPDAAERRRSHLPRDLELFTSWLEDRAADIERPADYFVTADPGRLRAPQPFTFSLSGSGCGANAGFFLRWREFDDGVSVRVLASDGEQPGVDDPLGGVQRSIAVWNNDNRSEVRLLYAGTTSVSTRDDDRNTVIPEDPFGNISGSFTGSGGGTLATAFVSFFCSRTFEFPGGTALEIAEADIITQDGSGANYFARRDQAAYDEVIAHEFGHFVGLGHSCGDSVSPQCSSSAEIDDALMRAQVHDDARGAQLKTDDRNAIRALYPQQVQTPNLPRPPTGLVASALSTSEIQLAWTDASGNETAFLVEERTAFGEFVEIESIAANTTSLIVTDVPAGAFRAYRVRARNTGGASAYTNEASATTSVPAGPCVSGANTLCLNDGRFRVTLVFEAFDGTLGPATAQELTDDTGYFTFFDPANVEVVVKVLDACALVDRYWVFAGGLTNVQVTLTVSDTTDGATRTYLNDLGTAFQPVQDTSAFASCP